MLHIFYKTKTDHCGGGENIFKLKNSQPVMSLYRGKLCSCQSTLEVAVDSMKNNFISSKTILSSYFTLTPVGYHPHPLSPMYRYFPASTKLGQVRIWTWFLSSTWITASRYLTPVEAQYLILNKGSDESTFYVLKRKNQCKIWRLEKEKLLP